MDFGASVPKLVVGAFAVSSFLAGIGAAPASAQTAQKRTILFIMAGSLSYLRPGTPALAWLLRDLGYTTGGFG